MLGALTINAMPESLKLLVVRQRDRYMCRGNYYINYTYMDDQLTNTWNRQQFNDFSKILHVFSEIKQYGKDGKDERPG